MQRTKMNVPLIIFEILYFLNVLRSSYAWDNDELEVFDVVEEVNQNFYEVLGVTQVYFLQYTRLRCPDVQFHKRKKQKKKNTCWNA